MWRGISFVRVGWPGIVPNERALLTTSVQLEAKDFKARGKQLTSAALQRLCDEVEDARTRSVAVRYKQLISNLNLSVKRGGGAIEGLSRRRSLIVSMPSGKKVAVYPSLGVPTSNTLFDATRDHHTPPTAVVYDEGGVEEREWKAHMEWISEQVKGSVRLLKCYSAGLDLSDWN
jgi:hypothetical protein